MSAVAGVAGPTAYWYLTRGTGTVAMLLLTASVALGVLDSERFARPPRWPRFVIDRIHRDVSLLVLVLVVLHVVTGVLDGFAPIALTDAVVPFVSAYRPLWLGLGALAFDVLLAVAVTSVLRRRIGHRRWRAVHWLAYLSWPVAIFHGLGTGSDIKQGWMLVLTVLCLLAVLAAAGARIVRSRPRPPVLRGVWLGLSLASAAGLALFTALGPLAAHWAQRAGTPVVILHRVARTRGVVVARAPARSAGAARDHIAIPFTAQLSGRVSQTSAPGGALVDLVLQCRGAITGLLRVRMAGAPMPGGGLSLTGSQVQLTAAGLTSVLLGQVDSLQGSQFAARVHNATGTAVELRANLTIDNATNTVTGTLDGTGIGG